MDSAARIKLQRHKRSWTQEQLAERAKLSTRTVQRVESGDESSAETLRLIAEAFGLPADSLRTVAMRTHFRAPWSVTVKAITGVVAALLVALPFIIPARLMWLECAIWGAALFSLFYSVAGFTVSDGQLLVHRLGWSTKFDLGRLSAFQANPYAMMGSIRLFGNGGFLCIIGHYRNGVLGHYRAYVTDPKNAVVLEFNDTKIVISPDDPQAFVETLHSVMKGVCKEPAADVAATGQVPL